MAYQVEQMNCHGRANGRSNRIWTSNVQRRQDHQDSFKRGRPNTFTQVSRRRRLDREVFKSGKNEWNSEVITLFVDNLPNEMCWEWLPQIFKFEGEVIDVYVSHKRRRKVRSSFGFVMFKYKQEAKEAIEHLDGMVI